MFAALLIYLMTAWLHPPIQDKPSADVGVAQVQEQSLEQVVLKAFRLSHEGYSSDEVILNDKLNQRFLKRCRSRNASASAFECNWKLMNMRKAGKLKSVETTKRGQRPENSLRYVAEIASRTLMDQHGVSIDKIMADPKKRAAFDQHVHRYDKSLDLYAVRKAAFQLRKARKLRPELITRIADWDRKIASHAVGTIRQQPNQIPELPGVYIFHDESGYLYIGQAEDLRQRLKQHLDESSNAALFDYLQQGDSREIWVEIHSFPADSRAKELVIRRAYESELIRSRKPKFNILP